MIMVVDLCQSNLELPLFSATHVIQSGRTGRYIKHGKIDVIAHMKHVNSGSSSDRNESTRIERDELLHTTHKPHNYKCVNSFDLVGDPSRLSPA